MLAVTEFWPLLHQLSEAYEQQGLTADERMQSQLRTFREMPPTVRRQLLADIFRLSMDLPDLYASMLSVANQGEVRSTQAGTG
jgi:hypothetical protein